MIKEAIINLFNGDVLSHDTLEQAMDEWINNACSDIELSSLLTALALKGFNPDDIIAFASSLKKNSLPFPNDTEVFEICGTGGDKSNSINISTISSIVVASCGIKTVKYGNRSSTCMCGSADFLEESGINIDITPEKASDVLEKIGITFLFAQKYIYSLKRVSAIRHSLPFPTVFNIIGPLTTPAKVKRKVLGVYDEKYVYPLAKALNNLGIEKGMVVYGTDGFDEVSVSAPTKVCEFADNQFYYYEITPEEYGLKRYNKSEIIGASPSYNVELMSRIFRGERGAPRDAILLNAGCAIHIATGLPIDLGIKKAAEAIDSGTALCKFEQWKYFTNH